MVQESRAQATSGLDASFLARCDYADAFQAPLSAPLATPVDLFFAVFGDQPAWIKRVVLVRNHLAALAGLKVPPASQILQPQRQAHYQPGDCIGPWPLYYLGEDELVAGRDNGHLDFRVSVRRNANADCVTVTTWCATHNAFGRAYLGLVLPFHRWGMRHILARACRAGRL